MKRLFVTVLVIVAMITIIGCAHKQVTQAPEQAQATPPPAPKPRPQKPVVETPVDSAHRLKQGRLKKNWETNVEDIHFAFDKSDIEDDAKPHLKICRECSRQTQITTL